MRFRDWLRRDVFLPRRRESAPPMPVHNYDPNANREEYLQAFDEFKQRGSKYNQMTLVRGNEENESPSSSNGDTNQVTNDTHVKKSKHQSNSVTTRRNTMPSEMTSLPQKSTHQKTNTPSTSVLPENVIDVNEVDLFEELCTNRAFIGSTDVSPPHAFYRENSHPYPSDMETPSIRPNISSDNYERIVNELQDIVQSTERHNTPVKSVNGSGISVLSEYESFRQCEDVVDENFEFLDECRNYSGDDEGEDELEHEEENAVKIKQLNVSVRAKSNHRDKARLEQFFNESTFDHDSSEQLRQNAQENSHSRLSLPSKHPVYIIECTTKDIQPKRSILRNTISTPLELSLGSFRKTNVTLKKCCPRDTSSIRLVEIAIERDYEILSKVKHPHIIILMAACFHRNLVNHMTLVLEPVDCTLNYFIHQMGTNFSILESISVVQQIGSAALYLQECGYIHSNISSHNILVREYPWSIKLSSFELATDIDCSVIQSEIELNYPQTNTNQLIETDQTNAGQSAAPEEQSMSLQEQYMEISKQQAPPLKSSSEPQPAYMSVPSKYLNYDTTYRQRLSLHNLTAPELLTSNQFVFPAKQTDVYSLCLVLWEILNKCVPFVVYGKVDMVRMVAMDKLNLPFFERERCKPFMDIFRDGLAVKLKERIMDVHQLIFKLDAIELLVRSAESDDEQDFSEVNVGLVRQNAVNYESHIYENIPPCVEATSSANHEPVQENFKNANYFNALPNLFSSPSLLDFSKTLTEGERTSTRKLKKKVTRPSVNQMRELFSSLNEAVDLCAVEVDDGSSFAELNENFREEGVNEVIDDIQEDDQVNENLKAVAGGIPNETTATNHRNKSHTPVTAASLVKENERPPKNWTPPTVVGFSVKAHILNDSKTMGNELESDSTSGVKRSLFNAKTDPCSSDYRFSFGGYPLPDTPIARQNYIRRNAWLLNQNPGPSSQSAFEGIVNKKDNDEVAPVNEDKKLNVSVRIVHNKVTPKKDDSGRPSILSKINFFNSVTETPKTEATILNEKHAIPPVKRDDESSNLNSPDPANILNQRIASEAFQQSGDNNFIRSGTFSSEKKTIMKDLKESMNNFGTNSSDQPQKKQSFENKLWKRELDICNRSLCSTDGGNDSKVITPKFRSVRDTIMKFEKRGELTTAIPSTLSTPTELVKSLPKISNTRNQRRTLGDSPTLIKRTVYSESVEFATLDKEMPMLDQFNLSGQKVSTRVSLRKIRQRSSDRHTICGSEIELLSFNSESLNNSMEAGASCPVVKYVCFKCASKMSAEEIKAFTCEPVYTNCATNTLEEFPVRRCQVRVKSQNTRSIEDLYIDDDFVHGLGANMELQSDCSDLFDYDMVSTDVFNKNYNAIEDEAGK